MSLLEEFRKNGYVIVRNALDAGQVTTLRARLKAIITARQRPQKHFLMPSETFSNPEIYTLPFNGRIVAACREIFGDPFAMVPDLVVHTNRFDTGPRAGWHYDGQSERRYGYMSRPDYLFAKCGLYLQDNSREWGGAIDAVKGGHRYFPIKRLAVEDRVKNLIGRFGKPVDLKAGDALIFDSRLPHTGTYPHALPDPQIDEHGYVTNAAEPHQKHAIYWEVCHPDWARPFMENSAYRAAAKEIGDKETTVFFSNYVRLRFPDDYPSDFVAAARENRIEVATLEERDCRFWRDAYAYACERLNIAPSPMPTERTAAE